MSILQMQKCGSRRFTSSNLVSQAHHCPLANVKIALLYASAHILLYGCIHLRLDALRPFNRGAAEQTATGRLSKFAL